MIERFGNKKWYRVIYDIKMSNNYDHQKKWDRKMLRIRWDLNIKIINGKSKMKFVLIGTLIISAYLYKVYLQKILLPKKKIKPYLLGSLDYDTANVVVIWYVKRVSWAMVFNATFNNISVISWWSVLLVEETGVPGENHRPAVRHGQTLSHNAVSSTRHHDMPWIHR